MESWKHLKWSVNIINYTTSIARCFKTGAFHYKVKIKFNGIEFNKIDLNAFKWLSSHVQVLSIFKIFTVNLFSLFQSRDPVFCRPRLGCAEVCAQGSTTMPTWGRVVPSTTDVVAATLITSRPEICVRGSVGFEVSEALICLVTQDM